ncbi:hypothetical protein CERSUDRAFT_155292 [Gelatoporia subvermispora B]|uniref:NACHT domain-containing protein n=1 Tax=Ceriporiopsis subvermispora (strain B) TaxID=914234 RepID=M2RDQ8_CERS8|nr:hypothetical protein CERSUDRAFT_155292 [Gelatoporia subvermispora B]
MEGTRSQLLDVLDYWARDSSSARVFWLNGMAGAGKSAIARTLCYKLRQVDMLGGSFFCTRGMANRDDVRRILPTLALSLARRSPAYRSALLRVLDKYPEAGHDNLELQVERLIKEPLCIAFPNSPPTLVLVIDALDECSDDKAMERILAKLISISPHTPIKFFLTSRPEPHIRSKFHFTQPDVHYALRLHEIEQDIVEADISRYISERLKGIRMNVTDDYPDEWPAHTDIAALTHRAGMLFIYAFTAMEYIMKDPVKRLNNITNIVVTAGQPFNDPLDEMYALILGRAMDPKGHEADEISATKRILAAILTVREPQRLLDLSQLMGISTKRVRKTLDTLHAVIHIPPYDDHGTVSTFHASFGDYVTTSTRSRDFFIDPRTGHHDLARSCITIMDRSLHFNISQIRSSCRSNLEQPSATIPTVIAYACLYWPHHLCVALQPESLATDEKEGLLRSLEEVLRRKFLFWLEVLSATQRVHLASNLIMRSLTTVNNQLATFLRDANEFIVSCRDVIELSAPHIYLSALPSISATSSIAQEYWPKFQNIPVFHARGIGRRRNNVLYIKGHTNSVRSVAFSPNGAFIASGSDDRTVQMWNAQTGEEVTKPFVGHTDDVNAVAFSPDGAYIASGSSDMTVRLWNTVTGEEVRQPLSGHDGRIWSVAFSPDGTLIISASGDKTIRVWDIIMGRNTTKPLRGHAGEVNSVAFSPDGTNIVSGSDDRTIRVWDVKLGREIIKPLTGHEGLIWSVIFSPDGVHIVSGSTDSTVRVWNARTGEQVLASLTGRTHEIRSIAFPADGSHINSTSTSDHTMHIGNTRVDKRIIEPPTGYDPRVLSVAFSPDMIHIASGSADSTIRVWNTRTGEEVMKPLTGHDGLVWSIAFSPDGTHIISGSADSTVRVWDMRTGEEVIEPLAGHKDEINSVAFLSNGTQIVSGSDDCTVRVWDTKTGEEVIKPLTGHAGLVWSVACSPDGTRIASGSADGTVRIWDARSGAEVLKLLTSDANEIKCVAFSPDGTRITSGSSDRTIRVWDAQTGEEILRPLTGHDGRVWSVVFSPDGTHIASGSADSTVRVWDARTGREVMMPLTGHTDIVKSVIYSPDGTHIASASSDKTIRLWNVTTGEEVSKPLVGHSDYVKSIAFSPDGAHIVSGSGDCTVRVWDTRTGKEVIKPLTGHSGPVYSVAFSPDGTQIASGSSDCTVRIFSGVISSSNSSSPVLPPLRLNDTHPRRAFEQPDQIPFPWADSISDISSVHSDGQVLDAREEVSYDAVAGWVYGPQGELILWIPPEYRGHLYGPRNILVIGTWTVSLDLCRYVYGEEWTKCYTPYGSSSC